MSMCWSVFGMIIKQFFLLCVVHMFSTHCHLKLWDISATLSLHLHSLNVFFKSVCVGSIWLVSRQQASRNYEAVIACKWQSLTQRPHASKDERSGRQQAGKKPEAGGETQRRNNQSCLVCFRPSLLYSLEAKQHQRSIQGKQSLRRRSQSLSNQTMFSMEGN